MVPKFRSQMAQTANMNADQLAFFNRWLDQWNNGNTIEIDGQISYVFCYMYDVLKREPDFVVQELRRLHNAYPDAEGPFGFYCQRWASDAFMLMGDRKAALGAFPEPKLDGRSAASTDTLLSLRLMLNDRVRARDIITLNGPKTTAWGREHLAQIVNFIEPSIRGYEELNGANLLCEWAKSSHKYKYSVYSGSVHNRGIDASAYAFSINPDVATYVRDITREAENTVREENGLPRVGEGWLSETRLYYQLKHAFCEHTVVHHARPKWLGRQHLDIFIESLRTAIEFQGPQHDEPVAYFGGIDGFAQCQKRDERKRSLCVSNGVRLIYVRECYRLHELVAAIRSTQ